MNVLFRPAHEGDMNYVLGSWVSGSKGGYRHTPWAIHSENYNRRINALLRRGASVTIAADPEGSNLIFGWSCYERFEGEDRVDSLALHWVNVKKVYRRLGLGKLLLAHVGFELREPLICSDASYMVHVLKDRYTVTVVPQLLEGLDL